MAEAATRTTVTEQAGTGGTAIDHDHLARMTFGDRKLQRELLTLFDRQSSLLLERMASADGPALAALAHTMKGSALGIGATRVAEAAAALEQTSGSPADALAQLIAAVAAARAEIARFLSAG